MRNNLVKIAKRAAKEEGLIYAPDIAALAALQRISKILIQNERESCAQLCEDFDLPHLAKAIREKE